MSTTSKTNEAPCALSRPLRAQLTALLLNPAAIAIASGSGAKKGFGPAPKPELRQAALFALDNFQRLQDAESNCITEEGLYALLYRGSESADERAHLSLLYRHRESLGHVIGTRTSTSHCAAAGHAYPSTFTSPRYGIDALDLFKMLCATIA